MALHSGLINHSPLVSSDKTRSSPETLTIHPPSCPPGHPRYVSSRNPSARPFRQTQKELALDHEHISFNKEEEEEDDDDDDVALILFIIHYSSSSSSSSSITPI